MQDQTGLPELSLANRSCAAISQAYAGNWRRNQLATTRADEEESSNVQLTFRIAARVRLGQHRM
jgi:hypothetical protein